MEHDHHPDFQTLLRLSSLKIPLIPECLRLGMTSGDSLHLVQMPLLKHGHLQLTTMFSCFFFLYLQGWRFHILPGRAVPAFGHPHSAHTCPGVQRGPPLPQFLPMLSHQDTFLAHVQLGAHQNPQVLFWFLSGQPQHALVPGAVPPRVQDFALPLAELWEVLSLLRVPVDSSTTLWCVTHSPGLVLGLHSVP